MLSSNVQFVLAGELFLCFVILWFEVCTTHLISHLVKEKKSSENHDAIGNQIKKNYWKLSSQTGPCFAMPSKRITKIVNCKMQLPEKVTLQLVVRAVTRIKLALQPLTIIWWSCFQLLHIMCLIISFNIIKPFKYFDLKRLLYYM